MGLRRTLPSRVEGMLVTWAVCARAICVQLCKPLFATMLASRNTSPPWLPLTFLTGSSGISCPPRGSSQKQASAELLVLLVLSCLLEGLPKLLCCSSGTPLTTEKNPGGWAGDPWSQHYKSESGQQPGGAGVGTVCFGFPLAILASTLTSKRPGLSPDALPAVLLKECST